MLSDLVLQSPPYVTRRSHCVVDTYDSVTLVETYEYSKLKERINVNVLGWSLHCKLFMLMEM